MNPICRHEIVSSDRTHVTAKLFGLHFPLQLEPTIYAITGSLASDYHGGYWTMYTLGNGGFYMAPATGTQFKVISPNGYEAVMSADALGVTACLYAYSQLSFTDNAAFAEVCAEQYHRLREYMLDHREAAAILGVID